MRLDPSSNPLAPFIFDLIIIYTHNGLILPLSVFDNPLPGWYLLLPPLHLPIAMVDFTRTTVSAIRYYSIITIPLFVQGTL